ncbi:MAG: hypothetical protein ACRD8K_02750 [Nitrososphaeraceae archaeon]
MQKFYLKLEELYDIVVNTKLSDEMNKKFSKVQPKYEDLIKRRGVIIKDIIHIVRKEETSSLFEDAGFCLETIKQLIE